jgi:subtilase family serine protease
MKTFMRKKEKQKIFCYAKLCIPVLLAAVSIQAHATDFGLLGKQTARTLYKIKPHTRSLAPSGLSPAQIRQAYGYNNISNQGEGQVIAIVEAFDNPNIEADLGVFNATFNLPECTTANGCFKQIYAGGSKPAGDTCWGLEMALAVQTAHSLAPKAKIVLVEAADDTYQSLLAAVDVAVKQGATVVSMGWGGNEFSGETKFDSVFNVPGVEFTAASGDAGSGVMYPAASPNVIAVGGTTLNVDASGNYGSETAWAGSSGGLSEFEAAPPQQVNFPIPYNPNARRGVPDISSVADPNTGIAVYDSFGDYGWVVAGGTAVGAPQIASMIAVIKSGSMEKLTGVNSMFYSLGKASYDKLYHDITSGSNGGCGNLCNAAPGYDYVTGLGSPKSDALFASIVNTDSRVPI